MKKYGDDADQFHNQGTRVELSKKWHEEHQLRHYYYYSPPKPKSTYTPKSTYKPKYNNPNLIICSKCGRQYNETLNDDCPYCSGISHKVSSDYKSTNKYKPKYNQINYPYNTYSKSKSNYESYINSSKLYARSIFVTCPECGMIYSKNSNSSCPHCTNLKKTRQDTISNTSAIIGFCVIVSVLLIILLMFLI